MTGKAPLEGIRVIDLTQGAAGPLCTMILADFGADVIKVEPPAGDWGRTLGPPFINGESVTFLGGNRNKKSITLNLKDPRNVEVLKKLVAEADIFVESFRPGVVNRLGVGYEAMAAVKPDLIYCSISAFGQTGPWKDKPGVDGVIQALSGLMSVTGEEGRPPVKAGTTVADSTGGIMAALAICLAVNARERFGIGQKVDVSLYDAMMTLQLFNLSMYLNSGQLPRRMGSAAPYAAPNEAIATADGYVMVAANLPDKWKRLCAVLGSPELEVDPRFATNKDRVINRKELLSLLEGFFREKSTTEWIAILEKNDIICAPIEDYEGVVCSPQAIHNQAFVQIDHPVCGKITIPGIAPKLSKTPGRVASAAPLLGEHTSEILKGFEAGWDRLQDAE